MTMLGQGRRVFPYYRFLHTLLGGGWTPALLPQDQLLLWCIQIEFPVTIDRLFWMSAAPVVGNFRTGIYPDNEADQPYSQPLLRETASIVASVAGFQREEAAIAELRLSAGLYWLATVFSVGMNAILPGPLNCQAAIDPVSHRLNHVFGALPDPYPAASTSLLDNIPFMGVRVASVP